MTKLTSAERRLFLLSLMHIKEIPVIRTGFIQDVYGKAYAYANSLSIVTENPNVLVLSYRLIDMIMKKRFPKRPLFFLKHAEVDLSLGFRSGIPF